MAILHVDLNSFFASCAVADSGGKYTFDTPLMVCGDPKRRMGIVLAATYPVKRLGVSAGMPIFQALQRCPDAILVPPDHRLYVRYSDMFMSVMNDYSPLVSRYGIDEAYMDYSGCEHLFGPPLKVAHTIKDRVQQELGLTVSVGVGDNMLMAKMGSDYKKPNAVTVINADTWRSMIWPLPCSSLMYVGHSTADKLTQMGFLTIGDIARCSRELLSARFGQSGSELWDRANGIDRERVGQHDSDLRKGIGRSTTLPQDVSDKRDIASIMLMLIENVCFRLREGGFYASVVTLHFRYGDFTGKGRQLTLSRATDITDELYVAGKRLLDELYTGRPVRQVGVRLTGLTMGEEQLSLFDDTAGRDKARTRDRTVDELRRRYGKNAVIRASVLKKPENTQESDHDPFARK